MKRLGSLGMGLLANFSTPPGGEGLESIVLILSIEKKDKEELLPLLTSRRKHGGRANFGT